MYQRALVVFRCYYYFSYD